MDPQSIGIPPVVARFLAKARGAGWLSAGAAALLGLVAIQLAWLVATFRFPCAEICTKYCTARAGQAGGPGWLGGHDPESLWKLPEVLGNTSAVLAGLFLGAALCYLVASARFGQALAELLAAEGWPGLRRAMPERAGPFPVAVLVVVLPGFALALLALLGSALIL